MSKAMQYMFVLSYIAIVVVFDLLLDGWWWAEAAYALIPALVVAAIMESFFMMVDGHMRDMYPEWYMDRGTYWGDEVDNNPF